MVHRGDHLQLLIRSVLLTDLLEAGDRGGEVFVSVLESIVLFHDQFGVNCQEC